MRFCFEQVIDLPRAVVFAFFENPENLELVHCGWSVFRVIQHDGRIHPGCRMWVESTVAGIMPVILGFEHTIFEPPRRFGESLIHGPFKLFTHIHEFDEVDGGTRVRDLVEVELPWCYGGKLATRAIVAPILRRAFECRQAALLQLSRTGEVARRTGQRPS